MSAPEQVQELLPCPVPWCGEAEQLSFIVSMWAGNACVECLTCHARGPYSENKEQAIAAWNTRHTAQSDLLAVMREAKEALGLLLEPLERAASEMQANGKVLDEHADSAFGKARASVAKLTAAIDQMGGG
jgi:Restriction alleviation protein Lar